MMKQIRFIRISFCLCAVLSPDKYYLKDNHDCLAVYKGDSSEIFFETDLDLSDLPEALRQKARSGLAFDSLQDLYGFLENYSS